MSNATKGGLFGAASKAAAGAKSLVYRAENLAIPLVLFAGVITIIKKNYTDDPWSYAMWFGVSLGIAALLYEMTSAKAIAKNWYQAKPGALAASAMIWVCAFGYSVNNWMGAASESQAEKTNLHQTAFVASQTAGDTLKAAKSDLDRIQKKMDARGQMLVNGHAIRTVEAAQADIDSAMVHKHWNTTDGCKEPKGKTTRAFCDTYRGALSEKSLAIEAATDAEELKAAKDAFASASKVSANTKTETSSARGDLMILTSWAGLDEQTAQTVNGLGAIIAVSIFLSFGSMRAEMERLQASGVARKRFDAIGKLYRWVYRILNGQDAPNTHVIERTIHTHDRTGLELLASLGNARSA